MTFTGTADVLIDPKQRLAIPAKFRAEAAIEGKVTRWYCMPWMGGILTLYPEDDFDRLVKAEHNRLRPKESIAEFERTFFGLTERLDMDGNGRVLLPKGLLDLTGLKGEVTVVGVGNRLEVHDRARWTAELLGRFSRLPGHVEEKEAARRSDATG